MVKRQKTRRIRTRARRRSGEAGMSLVEVTIAAAILLVVSIGVLPLFTRAIVNNRSGYDSNQASHLVRTSLEDDLALGFNHPKFDIRNPLPGHFVQPSSIGVGGEEMLQGDFFWDEGALSTVPAGTERNCAVIEGGTAKTADGSTNCVKLGDGGWVVDPTTARGYVLWQRRNVVREYTYADISEGVIDQAGNQLVTLGHSHFFDRPLASGDPPSSGHFREQTIELRSERAGAGGGVEPGQLGETTRPLGPGSQRTRMVRVF